MCIFPYGKLTVGNKLNKHRPVVGYRQIQLSRKLERNKNKLKNEF